MPPSPDPEKKPEPQQVESGDFNGAKLPEANVADETKLWEEYCRQQRRRNCPGCGDDGAVF
jgi:hypothetical protein